MSTTITDLGNGRVTISTNRLLLRGADTGDAEALHDVFSDAEVMRYWSTLPHTTLSQTQNWIRLMSANSQNGVTDFIICKKIGADTTVNADDEVDATTEAKPEVKPEVKPEAEPAALFAPIGKIGVWQGNEIGFLLRRSCWGKGLGQEALRAVLAYFFENTTANDDDGGKDFSTVTTDGGIRIENEENGENGDAVEKGVRDAKEERGENGIRRGQGEEKTNIRFSEIMADVDPRNVASLGLLKKVGFSPYEYQEKTLQIGGEWVDSLYLSITREAWIANCKTGGS